MSSRFISLIRCFLFVQYFEPIILVSHVREFRAYIVFATFSYNSRYCSGYLYKFDIPIYKYIYSYLYNIYIYIYYAMLDCTSYLYVSIK